MAQHSTVVRRAVIDVGTNSVKLLVADVGTDQVKPVLELGEQTRLGRGFYPTHQLQPDAIARTAAMIAGFVTRAHSEGAAELRAFATSAARDAVNADELIHAVRQAAGLDLTVIRGEAEAEWAFRGATSNPALADVPLLLVDVGGGSTEFILGCAHHRHFSRSFPMGTVRTLESLPHSDPPTTAEREECRRHIGGILRGEVLPALEDALRRERDANPDAGLRLVGTGGTVSILTTMELGLDTFDREQIEAARLAYGKVVQRVETLWRLPLAQRRTLPGLPPARADVMLAGAVILEQVMKVLAFEELLVSTRGLRFEALRALWPPAA